MRDVLCQMRITDTTESGGINEIEVAADELGKGGLRAGVRVFLQELLVRTIVHS